MRSTGVSISLMAVIYSVVGILLAVIYSVGGILLAVIFKNGRICVTLGSL